MTMINSEHFVKAMLLLLEETFEKSQAIYMDRGTSLFETLESVTSSEASIPVGGKCATLAAQVKHTAFFLDVLNQAVREQQFPRVDWGEIWRTVGAVNDEEWRDLQVELRQAYESIQELVKITPSWPSEREIAGAMSVVAHSAYHLGEIRQALCTLRP